MKKSIKHILFAATLFGLFSPTLALACVEGQGSCICFPGLGCFDPNDGANRP